MTAKNAELNDLYLKYDVNVPKLKNEGYQRIRLLNAIPTRTSKPLNDR